MPILQELHHIHKPASVTDMIEMERKILEQATISWETLPTAGAHFAPQVQKEVNLDNLSQSIS